MKSIGPGKKIRRMRLDLGARMGREVKQSEVAELIGVERATISAYETRDNANPSPEKIRVLADHFTIPLEWFYDGTENALPVTYTGNLEALS